jgi:hypothetical protein
VTDRAFTEVQLAGMQGTHVEHLMDTCRVGTRVDTQDSTGAAVAGYTWSAPLACGLQSKGGTLQEGSTQPITYDAQVRLPMGTVLGAADAVRVTKRHGVAQATPLEYEVVAPPAQGPAGLVLLVAKVVP